MRRIQPNTCGYDGFICKGIKKLKELFMTTPVDVYSTTDPAERDKWVWSESVADVEQPTVDNYAQVPQAFEGFVMTLNPIIDMDVNANIEVPELSCRTNMDPFSVGVAAVLNEGTNYTVNPNTANSGLIDLYNQVVPYNNTVYDTVDNGEHYILKLHIAPVYSSDKVRIVGPGLLEPMLDTMFPAVGVDTITGPDALGDFTVWLFDEFNKWKDLIDDRLNNIYQAKFDYSKVNGMINLEDAKNREGGCYNFNISTDFTTAVIGESVPAQTYSILGPMVGPTDHRYRSGGKIKIDGTEQIVASVTGVTAPFAAYLDIFKYQNDEDELVPGATIAIVGFAAPPESTNTRTEVNPETEEEEEVPITGFTHLAFEYIGGVRSITNTNIPEQRDYNTYTLYEIEQGDCIYDITLSGGTGGGEPCEPWEYDGPFHVVQGYTAGTVDITGIDYIGDVPYAGLLCRGATCSLKDVDTVAGAEAGDDVYANIKIDGSISYSYAIETGWEYVANIRLARIESFNTYYTVELSGTTFTTPSTDTTHKAGNSVTTKDTLTHTIDQFCPGGGIIEGPDAAQKNYVVQAGATGKIYGVDGGTFTGVYQTGGTACVRLYDESSIKQIHFGDLYVDDMDQFYNGPFKLSITGETVYLAKGSTASESSVIGAPVEGATASDNLISYKVTVVDGSHQIPSSGSISYAGYAIVNGSSSRDKIEEYSFNLDSSASTTVFLVGTKNGATWSFAYDTEPGNQSDAPNLTQVVVDGVTVYGSTVTVDEVIGGTTAGGVVTGGSTVSAINGGTITAYKIVDGNTVYTDYVTPQRYAISLGSVTGDSIKQIQYGNIYIDDMGGTAPAPVVGSTYSGPFHLLPSLSFETVETEGQTNYIGDVVLNGDARSRVPATTVSGSTVGGGTATEFFVYAHITAGNSVAFDTDPSPGGTPPAYTVRIAKVSGVTTTVVQTVDPDTHETITTYDLDPIAGSTVSVSQYHYGDLYVDGRWT